MYVIIYLCENLIFKYVYSIEIIKIFRKRENMIKKKIFIFLKSIKNKKFIKFIDQLVWRIQNHRIDASSAQMAYFTLLSLFPFFMLMLNLISTLSLTYSEIIPNIINLFPEDVRSMIYGVIIDLNIGFGGNLQLILTSLGTLYSASFGINSMIFACNLAFGSEKEKSGIVLILKALIFTFAFMILILLLFITGIMGDKIFSDIVSFFKLPKFTYTIWYYFKNVFVPAYIILMLNILNRFSLPKHIRTKIKRYHLLPGAFISMALMMLLSYIFAFRTSNSDSYAITYGSLSTVIMLIVWLYLMGTSLVIGFEVNGTIYYMLNKPEDSENKSVLNEILK